MRKSTVAKKELLKLERQRRARQRQQAQMGRAAELFNKRRYGTAKRYLVRAAKGPDLGLAHRARVFLRICEEKKRARFKLRLKTAEDYYNYAVKLINDQDHDEAVAVAAKGLIRYPDDADLLYAKAVAKVALGEIVGAVRPLKRAIDLDPRLRLVARQDPDLKPMLASVLFKEVLGAVGS